MQSMFKKLSKMHIIVQECEEPKRFSELKRTLGISDSGLTKHLNSLQKLGWLEKAKDSRYVLTEAGRRALPNARRASAAMSEFRRTPTGVEGLTLDWVGITGPDGGRLLKGVGSALKRYAKGHPEEHFVVMASYRPK